MEICDKAKCTACGACRDACPKGCIRFERNEYGTESVVINEELCVNCGKCKQVCQVLEPVEKVMPKLTYAVCLKDLDKRNASASGGAAYALYSKVLEMGGVAYGAVFNENHRVVFKKVTDPEHLSGFQGSKYTYSDMNGTYKDILNELNNGQLVIFVGTSCQCAGLQKFVPKALLEKLYLVDIICHGMPPAAYFDEYIAELEKDGEAVDEISFRDNNIYRFKASSKSSTLVEEKAVDNLFMANYTRMVFYRESCYSCSYASPERCTDLTVGDYWGKDRKRMLAPTDKGMSVVMCNTDKGRKLIEKCGDRLVLTLKPYEDIIKSNEQLRGASKKPYYRQLFLDEYKEKGFITASGLTQNKISEDVKKKAKTKAPLTSRIKWKLKSKYQYLTDYHKRGKFMRDHVRNKIDRARLKNKDFSIISNNCIGGVISHDLGLQFKSPTVNLLIKPDDFVKFLENFDYYKNLEIVEIPYYTDYPVGMLGDIPLFFKHYNTFDEAVAKWKERMNRINYDNLFIMMSDRFCMSYSSLERFEKLPFKNKVCFTAKDYPEFEHCVQVKKKANNASVFIITNIMNYFGKRLYQYGKGFDYIRFLNEGTVK
ncbi:DUF1919 domain-containing protein [Butyrivibrio sp. XPD2006]|uniref:DUF1919 domain-containing protein n=1 Tax=Butyrivibrio sp. XPD2006 TaxID=1280668 RepID=UPI0003B7095F|nr:DUF1919 domain-containing protein [Butyrivibrio sp. XPD2006]